MYSDYIAYKQTIKIGDLVRWNTSTELLSNNENCLGREGNELEINCDDLAVFLGQKIHSNSPYASYRCIKLLFKGKIQFYGIYREYSNIGLELIQ